ncbi:MAG: hypothetical protein ACLSXM_09485, partial [Turicibacter sanguinis]
DLNTRKDALLIKLEEIEVEESETQELIKNGIPTLSECDLKTQTHIVDLFINKIIVTGQGLQIIWNQ